MAAGAAGTGSRLAGSSHGPAIGGKEMENRSRNDDQQSPGKEGEDYGLAVDTEKRATWTPETLTR